MKLRFICSFPAPHTRSLSFRWRPENSGRLRNLFFSMRNVIQWDFRNTAATEESIFTLTYSLFSRGTHQQGMFFKYSSGLGIAAASFFAKKDIANSPPQFSWRYGKKFEEAP